MEVQGGVLASVCAVLLLVGGCTTPRADFQNTQPLVTELGGTRVVVGIVDTGMNPYHEVFQVPGLDLSPDFVDALTGAAPIALRLSKTGSFADRRTEDASLWASVQKDTLYWFEGTPLLGLSLRESSSQPLMLEGGGHGSEVASVLRNVGPETWIVAVQTARLPAGQNEEALAYFEKSAKGVRWLAEQPWVDVISVSLGIIGNPPLSMWTEFVEATRFAVEEGKVVVVGAGNEPTPSFVEGSSGPPWVINVGGADSSARGDDVETSKFIDVVANTTQRVAATEPDEYRLAHGTSFATPAVAANVANALLEMRRNAGSSAGSGKALCDCGGRNVSQADLRSALNASATYWNSTDWDPLNYPAEGPLDYVFFPTAPILPTPWLQMGWGYVGNDTWRTMVETLQGRPPQPHSAEAVQYMAAQQAAREAYWSLPR